MKESLGALNFSALAHRTPMRQRKRRHRDCQCTMALPEGQGCGGEPFLPTARGQKYRPECAALVEAQRVSRNNRADISARSNKWKWMSEDARALASQHGRHSEIVGRNKRDVCRVCYDLQHARPASGACPGCGRHRIQEVIEQPECTPSSPAGWM